MKSNSVIWNAGFEIFRISGLNDIRWLKYLLLFFFLTFQFVVFAGDFYIGNTSVKIGANGVLVLKDNISVSASAMVWNDGALYWKNNHEATLNVNTILGGTGQYFITGSTDCFIEGVGGAISSLILESGKTLWINNNFSVTSNLILESGIINVADNVGVRILNTDVDAIGFHDSYNNTSFIRGRVIRNVLPGFTYKFPLGTKSEGYHPFELGNISSAGYIGVTHLPGFENFWNEKDNKGVTVESTGAWQVSTDFESISFTPSLSLYYNDGTIADNCNILFSTDTDASVPDFLLDYNSITNLDYLTTETPYSAGTFAASKIKMINTEDPEDNELVPSLVNLIVADGEGRITFEVPGINNYTKVVLNVYNRFGSLVYKNNYYANDFDSRKYQPGTYYYELVLTTDNEKKILVRNFIEIMRHN